MNQLLSEVPSNFPKSPSEVASKPPMSQGRLFQWLRWRQMRNSTKQLFGTSRVRVISMILCSLIIWVAMFAGGYGGFGLIANSKLFFAGGIVALIFDALFFTLGMMLVFSTGLILYASLYTSAESRFLLTTPARADQIFATKFQGAIGFSSWAFIILGSPVLIAYGVIFSVPWYYYPLLPVFFLGYTLLPGTIGAVLCLLIVNFLPKQRRQALIVFLVLAVVLAGYWIVRLLLAAGEASRSRDAIQNLFDMFFLAQSKFSPSQWMSRGLLALARGSFTDALFPLALLWSNGLMLYLVSTYLAKHLYRRSFNRMSDGGGGTRRYRVIWLDRVMEFLVGYLDPRTRMLIVKDFRTFRREPAQVGQLIIFTGLMLLGVINIRQFLGADIPVINQSVVSLLNLAATGLLMCAYLARFIYPLISLEGKKFWILGLLPVSRDQLLWGKFAFAVTMTTLLTSGIIVLSDLILGVSPVAIVLHGLTMICLAIGLSGMAVGMSAWMPNFRETDPSKIVSGFGGTMFTIASLMYLVLITALISVPYHVALLRETVAAGGSAPWWSFAGIVPGILLCALACSIPMRLGLRKLESMEF